MWYCSSAYQGPVSVNAFELCADEYTWMAVLSLGSTARAEGVSMKVSKASLDGARMVILVAEPSVSARPGTPLTAAARLDKDSVEARRSASDIVDVEFDIVMFWAEAMAAKAAIEKSCEYIVKLPIDFQRQGKLYQTTIIKCKKKRAGQASKYLEQQRLGRVRRRQDELEA